MSKKDTKTPQNPNTPLQFNYVPYPLWRRHVPLPLRPLKLLATRYLSRHYPVAEDRTPPKDPRRMARYLDHFRLMSSHSVDELSRLIEESEARIEDATSIALEATGTSSVQEKNNHLPIRLPAQWETNQGILLNWPILYPPLWELHAQMTEAIAPVAEAVITIPAPMWAHAAWIYLRQRGKLSDDSLKNVRFLVLPTDDIWVRDYGPTIGLDSAGKRVVVDAIYDPLPFYPQARDDSMPLRFAAHEGFLSVDLALHHEGGNLWTDGAGMLIMTDHLFYTNPYYDRARMETLLHSTFAYDKLIITPHMAIEQTGHVDLVAKLADAQTVLVSAPCELTSAGRLRAVRDLFRHETNAHGQRYNVIELPTPPLYFNFWYPIRRSYTNALTVNGRVLVPTYGIEWDDEALKIYAEAMPNHEIIPIDCKAGANGGGAVHCMTKEIPAGK